MTTYLTIPNPTPIQLGGRELHYTEQGKGQAVIFIHGAINDYRSWQFQMDLFQANIAQSHTAGDSLFPIREQGMYLKIPQLKVVPQIWQN
jgi:hypothetical protein